MEQQYAPQAEQDVSVGGVYAGVILQKWISIMEYSEAFTVNRLSGEYDDEICRSYVAKMTRLWKELKVKVRTRADFKDVRDEFLKFEPYCVDPARFFPASSDEDGKEVITPDGDEIYKLENVLREVIEKLRVTEF